MGDGTTAIGTGPLRLPAVLDASQQQALAVIAQGLTRLTSLLQAVEDSRAGAALPADALGQTAAAGDALLAGGQAYLTALAARQGRPAGGLDPQAPLQGLLQGIQGLGPERLEDFCSLELPWALATALAQVPPVWTARLLQLVSDDLQDKVVILLGVMTQAGEGAMDVVSLLAVLRALPAAAAERITVSIEQLVPALSEALYHAVCDGSILLALDDGALQRLIPRLPHREWGLLLKYATAPVRERVFRNVTGRVARMLQEEIELARPGGLASLVAVQHRLQAAITDLGV